MFADCGNDARICVLDSRQSSSAPVIVIEDEASHGCVVGTDRLRTMLLAGLRFQGDAVLSGELGGVAPERRAHDRIGTSSPTRHSICIGCSTAVSLSTGLISPRKSLSVEAFLRWSDETASVVQVSFAPTCLLHDLRKPSAILHTLSGHVAPHLSRSKAIYHPHFVDGGKGLLVTGEVRSETVLEEACC